MPESREMRDLHVYVSEGGYVCLAQEVPYEEDKAAIVLHPDQVELVCQWLREAVEEAKKQD